MQDNHLFEYAIIRLVPLVERGEFINIGVGLYSSGHRFCDCQFHLDIDRINALFKEVDVELVQQYVHSFEKICRGEKDGGPIAQLSMPERFRWLTASRSTIIQCSPVHIGNTQNPEKSLKRLFEEMVGFNL
ncbi:MAG: hypothetical protein CMP48_09575 [Rickettsiales bacterium]|nr:hypothetical protein [Rickettsiales bacterium]